MNEEDLKWWLDFAPRLHWTFAKTMKTTPHWYVVQGKTPGVTHAELERAARVIHTFGHPEQFNGTTRLYLTNREGTYKWFTMDGPVENIYLINMAPADQYFGEQRNLSTETHDMTDYDLIATQYDDWYRDAASQSENEWVRRLIQDQFGAYAPKTLDVGCGTGLLLDLQVTAPGLYTGIDPSRGMLNQLVLKHPKVNDLRPGTAESCLPDLLRFGRTYELVTSLFASPSYMDRTCYEQMFDLTSRMLVLMAYQEGAAGHFYEGQKREEIQEMSRQASVELARFARREKAEKYQIGHFDVAVIRR